MDDTAQGTRPPLPPGESYDSLELKRQKMEEIHLHEGLTGAERGDVCKLMEFFKGKPTNDEVRNILSRGENDVTAMALQLLLAHFKENLDGLVLQADEFAIPSDIQQSLHLPESQSLSNRRWMLSMEGHVVCEGAQPNFVSGLAALFSTFYNFNLQYQEEAACTLEFVQRRFLDINPERGSKAKKGKVTSKKTGHVVHKKKNSTVNPHVSSLLRKLADFEWDFV
ncbi:hypothetical protein DNTS_002151 [Danionella cerebrum]|uniref:Uncharacterized protein n=1 Tax=Danionella cerebrum TaxID=2873325 RepID=A0A553QUU2_9TELE|nr:hypothetical protein DNTS_002151 [Danionella translucida]